MNFNVFGCLGHPIARSIQTASAGAQCITTECNDLVRVGVMFAINCVVDDVVDPGRWCHIPGFNGSTVTFIFPSLSSQRRVPVADWPSGESVGLEGYLCSFGC
jgi:hypothetical protein